MAQKDKFNRRNWSERRERSMGRRRSAWREGDDFVEGILAGKTFRFKLLQVALVLAVAIIFIWLAWWLLITMWQLLNELITMHAT